MRRRLLWRILLAAILGALVYWQLQTLIESPIRLKLSTKRITVNSQLQSNDPFDPATLIASKLATSLLKYVDPLIGTEGEGHVWVGASVPHGKIKVGVDSDHTQQGYRNTLPVMGISHTHVSGTGGGRSYQNMVLTPHFTASSKPLASSYWMLSQPQIPKFKSNKSEEVVLPGYYSAYLEDVGVWISMTASNSFAKHRWAFNLTTVKSKASLRGPIALHVLLKAKHDSMKFLGGTSKFENGRIMLSAIYQDGWSSSFEFNSTHGIYQVHACMKEHTDSFARVGLMTNYDHRFTARPAEQHLTLNATHRDQGGPTNGENLAGFMSFEIDDSTSNEMVEVFLDVGISFLSIEAACKNLEEATRKSFSEIVAESQRAWEQVLDPIIVSSPIRKPEDTTILYSSLYRTFFMPVNRTGEPPGWPEHARNNPYFDDYYCLWDTYRTLHPLLTLINPELQSSMVNSLISSAKYANGYLGDCHVGNSFGITQGGNNAEILVVDAFLKKIPGINYTEAYLMLKRSADTQGPLHRIFEGRGDVEEYIKYGYVGKKTGKSYGISRRFRSISASRTLEYAYADFTIALMAKGLGHLEDFKRYLKRSGNWQNLWDSESTDRGFTGFIQPRLEGWQGGHFSKMPPAFGSPIDHYNEVTEFYEDSPWAYSFFVPQTFKGLIARMGGDATFISRLDTFFKSGIYNPGNEPAFLTPFLYHYAGRPSLSTQKVDKIIDTVFTANKNGIPGNDDAATMGAWYILAAVGMFPVAGQDIYLIVRPRFQKIVIKVGLMEDRRSFVVNVFNSSGSYISRVEFNGANLSRSWLRHDEIANGGVLNIYMGESETAWGTQDKDRPPSWSPEHQ